MSESQGPPRLAEWLLERLVPRGDFGEALVGDLREEFAAVRQRSRFRAHIGYWLRVLRLVPRLVLSRGELEGTTRRGRGETMLDGLWTDIGFAVRLLARRRTFAAILLFTIALGIGSATSIFSVVDAVLIRSLPYPRAEQLVSVHRTIPRLREDPAFGAVWDQLSLAYPEYRDWREQQTSFESVGVWLWNSRTLEAESGAERVDVLLASASLLEVLGLRPQLGRMFGPDDEGFPGGRMALITDEVWRRQFGGRADVVGRTMTLSGDAYRIEGVLPAGLQLPRIPLTPGIWLPAGSQPRDTLREDYNYTMIARLRAGVTVEQATAETGRIFRFGGTPSDGGARLVGLQEDAIRAVRAPFLLLLAAAGLLLLITCVNVAALLLGAGAARGAELAARLALGARRGRLLRQLLTEQVVVAAAGALLGVLLAYWTTRMLVGLAPAGTPRLHEVAVNWRSGAFAAAAALMTAMVFGLAPAVTLVRESASAVLRSTSPRSSLQRSRLQRAAVGVQLGLAVVLMVGATLLVRSLKRLSDEPAGFDANQLVHVLPLFGPSYAETAAQRLYITQVLAGLEGAPGIVSASASSSVPFTDGGSGTNIQVLANGLEQQIAAQWRVALPGYLATLGTRLIEGRDFDATDRAGAAPVALVNEALALNAWPGQPAIGQRLRIDNAWREVVGVVGNVKHRTLGGNAPATFYLPAEQTNRRGYGLLVRAAGDPALAIETVRQRMKSVDAGVAAGRVDVLAARIASTMAPQRFRTLITSFFAVVAMLLTAAGLYGVTADAATRRLREMAIRIALGATQESATRLSVRATVLIGAVGALAGGLVALGATRALVPFLYDISAADPLTYALVIGGALLVSAIAAWLPARRAARAQPAELLRAQ